MPNTAIVTLNHAGTLGDRIRLFDARGHGYWYVLGGHTGGPDGVPVALGNTAQETATNLWFKFHGYIGIKADVDLDGTMHLIQDPDGGAEPILVEGDTFTIVEQFQAKQHEFPMLVEQASNGASEIVEPELGQYLLAQVTLAGTVTTATCEIQGRSAPHFDWVTIMTVNEDTPLNERASVIARCPEMRAVLSNFTGTGSVTATIVQSPFARAL
jgi:hypothetical protein